MRRTIVVAGILLALVAGGLRAQGVRDEALRNMTPQQREQWWRSMTPQQRGDVWRQLTPEQRQSMRQPMSPEQREALRNRMMEERRGGALQGPPPAAGAPDAAAPGPGMRGGPHGPRRWSPEERQRFREQILESTRDLRDGSEPRRRMERRKNRDR